MTDGTGRPELYPLEIHVLGASACIGAFDLKCDVYETCAARLANEVGFGCNAQLGDTLDHLVEVVVGGCGVAISVEIEWGQLGIFGILDDGDGDVAGG